MAGYSGWANYETWAVKLWIDNEQGSYYHWQEQARECISSAVATSYSTEEEEATRELARRLRSEHEDAAESCTVPGVFGDLVAAALGNVDWGEIADSMVEEAKECTEA
jgi:hypothetical protein